MSALDDLVNRHDNHCPCFFRNSRLEFCICNAINAINELTSLHTRIAELEAETVSLHHVISECEDYLKSMVEQYCRHSSGENRYCHDFMSAGECTFEYLVARGLAEYTENGVDIRLKVKE